MLDVGVRRKRVRNQLVTWSLIVCLGGCSVFDAHLLDPQDAGLTNPAIPRLLAGQSAAGTVAVARLDASAAAGAGGSSPVPPPACAQHTTPTQDSCTSLPKLPAAPVIDGNLECGLTLQPIVAMGWNGTTAQPPTKQASYAAAWRPDGLYVFVRVTEQPVTRHPAGQPLYCGDAVELYVDGQAPGNQAGKYGMGTMQFVIAAPSTGAGMEAGKFTAGNPQGAWISNAYRTTSLPDGYSVEAFITAADLGLWQWAPSTSVAFSLAIDVASSSPDESDAGSRCGLQAGQFFLRVSAPSTGCTGEPWCDVRAFCSATLQQ